MKYNLVMKRNKLFRRAIIQLFLKYIMLSERSLLQKSKYYMISFIWHSGKKQNNRKRVSTMPGLRGRRRS
jgi:hypothetical protein